MPPNRSQVASQSPALIRSRVPGDQSRPHLPRQIDPVFYKMVHRMQPMCTFPRPHLPRRIDPLLHRMASATHLDSFSTTGIAMRPRRRIRSQATSKQRHGCCKTDQVEARYPPRTRVKLSYSWLKLEERLESCSGAESTDRPQYTLGYTEPPRHVCFNIRTNTGASKKMSQE